MAGNKRRTGRPGGMTGTAPARVPARHNTAERRRTQSGKRQAVSGNVRQEGNRQVSEGQKQAAQRPRPAAGQRQAAADRRPDLGYPAAGNRKKARPAQSYESRDARAYQPQNPPKKKKVRRFYDLTLVLIVVALTVFGLVMIYSASSYTAQISEEFGNNSAYFMRRQGIIAAGGFVLMLFISKMDYHWLYRLAVPSYALSYVLMILVSIVGKDVNGKKRWLGVGPFSFQPAEFAKIALIIMLAAVITKLGGKINQWKTMGKVFLLALAIAAVVALNNLSTGIILAGIGFVVLFVACKVKWPFFAAGGLALGTLAAAGPIGTFLLNIHLLQPYQFRRIEAWLNPELDPEGKSFQVLQGLYAIGSGGLMGQGMGESIQKLGFLPESQNDMIFAIICEELGLFGAVAVIMLFLLMIYRFVMIANDAPDLFGALLVVGIMGHIAIQVILNIAVVTNTIPNTGITLPFISYGGTSVLFLMVEMGIVLSVSNQIKAVV